MNNKKSSIVDPVVRVEVYGVPADVAQEETHHVENNGTFRFDMFHLAKCKSHDASAFGSIFRIVVECVCTSTSLSRPECNAATTHFRADKRNDAEPLRHTEALTPPLFFPVEGFNPTWNENFQFEVYVPELALVRFVVEDYDSTSDNEFVGQYTLPFNSLKMGKWSSSTLQPRHTMGSSLTATTLSLHSGYKHVPLLNKNGDVLPSAGLFVHIMVLDAE